MVDDENGIEEVPDRSRSRLARAPQSFWLKDIIGAHRKAIAENKHDFVLNDAILRTQALPYRRTAGKHQDYDPR